MPKNAEEKNSILFQEVPGLIFAFLAVTLFLALISFDIHDPSLSRSTTIAASGPMHNYIGVAGAYAAGLAVDLLGLASFWIVGVLGIISHGFFRGRPLTHPWLVLFGLLLLLLSLATILGLAWPQLAGIWPGKLGGGVLGDFLARFLTGRLNLVGAWLATLAALLLAALLATGISIIRSAGWILAGLRALGRVLALAWAKRRERREKPRPSPQPIERPKDRPEPKIKENAPVPAPPVHPTPLEPVAPKPRQEAFAPPPEDGPFRLPGPELLDEPQKNLVGLSRDSLMANARLVEKKLEDFHVSGQVLEVSSGPVITMYEYQPSPGVKISKVSGLADDLAMNMRAMAIRIVAPLPGKAAIGIEIPNPQREVVYLKEVVSTPAFAESRSLLTLVMGVDIMGQPVVADLQKMPHLLIAGATGSGKSVGLNAIIMSILFKAKPEEVRFMMIDPKRIELTPYRDLPHLIYPVISEPKDANQALRWAVADMEHRYQLLAEKGVRNIESYNRKLLKEKAAQAGQARTAGEGTEGNDLEPLPYLVIIIDELADLMMIAAKEVETSITRLAQMARAAGIHLILATQRPSVDVLTGVIKANLPTRVSFQVSSRVDSRTIIDSIGAEKLLGAGDMLYLPPGTGRLTRIHGAYVSDAEIKRVTDFVKAQQAPNYLDDLEVAGGSGEGGENQDEYDEKYDEAVALVARTRKASISLIQRHLRIGYNRAARIIEIMEKEGVVGPADGARPREVLVRDL